METVTVTVPDGIYEGQEFTLEYKGQSLVVVCPDGCAGGDDINLQIEVPAGGGAAPPKEVIVAVPAGCYPGDEFTVEFDGQAFNIAVPDGVRPGQEITVTVPDTGGGGGMAVTDELFAEALERGSRFGNKPDQDLLRWALTAYCEANGDIEATFRTLGDNSAEALKKPLAWDTPAKFAANWVNGLFKVRAIPMTDAMFDEALRKAPRGDHDVIRMALSAYCENAGNIEATFKALADNPAEALAKPTYCDTPPKFAANYVLGYFKVRT